MKKVQIDFSGHIQTIEEIFNHYKLLKDLIKNHFDSEKNPLFDVIFENMTSDEILKLKEENLLELERSASFNLLALVEARFRIDFCARCDRRKRDTLSNLFREFYNPVNRIYSYSYKDQILANWKVAYPDIVDLINEIGQVADYRNWLAHGRFWEFKDNLKKYTFNYIHDLTLRTEAIIWPLMEDVDMTGQKA